LAAVPAVHAVDGEGEGEAAPGVDLLRWGKDKGNSCPGAMAKVTLIAPPLGKPDPRMVTCWLGTPCLGTPATVAARAAGCVADCVGDPEVGVGV
jgi:hypothetical protein